MDAALDLHVRALVAAREGNLADAEAALIAAQQWESAHGYTRAPLHTSHQLVLMTNFNGDLDHLARYYRETLRTLKRLRNREGLALCLRTTGELAFVNGDREEMRRAWELSERLFVALGLPEAEQMRAWMAWGRETA
ncbi:MAG TPA: hypothetical protein VNA69_11725 [Thermoanaerobaculia bacterium]|nr:hypothetical protein [Thermoanaerobaculia bacterium]